MKTLIRRLCCWEDSALRFLVLDSPRSYRVCLALLAGCVASLTLLLFVTGCSHQVNDPVDASILLDGLWRLCNGQRPHHDFFSIIGVAPLLVLRLGALVGGVNVNALAYGVGLLFPLVSAWGWIVARRRFSAPIALGFALYCGTLLIATVPLGYHSDIRHPSYEMQYNRLGWALFCLLIGTVAIAPRVPLATRAVRLEGLVTGAIVGALLFTKINYLGMSVVALGMGLILVRPTRRLLPGIVAGCALACFAFILYLHFDLVAYLRDLKSIAAVAQKPADTIFQLRWLLQQNFLALAFLVMAFALLALRWLRLAGGVGRWSTPFPSALLVCGSVVAMGILICRANTQSYQIPLFAVSGLILCETYRREFADRMAAESPGGEDHVRFLFANGVSLTLLAGILVQDASSVVYSAGWKFLRANRAPLPCRIEVGPLRDMALPWYPGELTKDANALVHDILERAPAWHALTPALYARAITDGIELLRPHCTPQTRIFVMDAVNPFSFALQIPPPFGVPLCYDCTMLGEGRCPPAETLFKDVNTIMVPKGPQCKNDYDFLMHQYGSLLTTDFKLVGESPLWSVYVRTNPHDSRN